MMNRHKIFVPLVTVSSTFDTAIEPDHSHNFYEIIYIKKGKGIHFLNGEAIDFKAGSLFLIDPYDLHHFESDKNAEFVLVQFTESFLVEKRTLPKQWITDFKQLVASRSLKNSMFQFDGPYSKLIKQIFQTIEHADGDSDIIYLQILSVIEIIRKSIAEENEIKLKPTVTSDGKIEDLLSYIHQNISEPEKLKTEQLAHKFGISKNYVSAYFKKNVDLSLKEYIDKYRLELIKKKLIKSEFNMKQIAYDFGFTDESHLRKFYKKHTGQTPIQYRKKERLTK